ncbi:MAG: AAA family ATPase [Methylocystaceae bacterium]
MEISLRFPPEKLVEKAMPPSLRTPPPLIGCVMEDLERLIGLNEVKDMVREIVAYVYIQKERNTHNLKAGSCSLHMMLTGNPGTGKTTVARILGRILKENQVLSRGHLVEVERADLVGEYVGHTAQKTREQIKKALGGVLFIDEAYTLAQGGNRDFGQESIGTLVKAMEENRDNLVVILAGYPENMNRFIHSNPGLASRFPIVLRFPDYSQSELLAIAMQMYHDRDYELTSRAKWRLKNILAGKMAGEKNGNARLVRNIVEKSIRIQAVRLYSLGHKPDRNELQIIEETDLQYWYPMTDNWTSENGAWNDDITNQHRSIRGAVGGYISAN